MHEGRLDLLRVDEAALAQLLVRAPARARDDARARADVRLHPLARPGSSARSSRSVSCWESAGITVRRELGDLGGARGLKACRCRRRRRGGERAAPRGARACAAARAGLGCAPALGTSGCGARRTRRPTPGSTSSRRRPAGSGDSPAVVAPLVHLRLDAHLDAVRVADPQRRRGSAHPARVALGRVRVGPVFVVVRLDVLPAGPVRRCRWRGYGPGPGRAVRCPGCPRRRRRGRRAVRRVG